MKFRYLFLCLLALILFACTHSNKDMIAGVWRGVKLENTTIDSFFIKSQRVIDTIGKYNDPDRNYELYGTSNMDSVRHALQLQHDSAMYVQNKRVTCTVFSFTRDRKAYITFDDRATIDTAHWNFDDEGALIVEDLSQGGGRTVKRMQVLQLTDSLLRIEIWNGEDSSKITFRKVAE